MTDKQTPPDWVLIEAAKRSGCSVLVADYIRYNIYEDSRPFRALCDTILKYEQPPPDRKLLCAEEAYQQMLQRRPSYREVAVRAIELWEEGFGK